MKKKQLLLCTIGSNWYNDVLQIMCRYNEQVQRMLELLGTMYIRRIRENWYLRLLPKLRQIFAQREKNIGGLFWAKISPIESVAL